jgi:NADPH2:quinone reductase
VGKDTLDMSLKALAKRGLLVSFGNASGPARAVEPLELSRGGSLFLTRPTLFDYVTSREELEAAAARLWQVLERGAVKVDIGQTFPLAEARAAHEALEGRRTTGATLLMP